MDLYKIGDFIYHLRSEKSLSQSDFGKMLDVTNKAVSRWENGYNLPDAEILKKISKLFNVSIDEILNGEFRESKESLDCNKNLKNKKRTINKKIIYFSSTIFVTLVIMLIVIIILRPLKFDKAEQILRNNNYQIDLVENPTIYNSITINAKTIYAYDESNFATIYYFNTNKEAKEIYYYLYQMYQMVYYSPDIYGFKNQYLLYYNLVTEPIVNHSELTLISYDFKGFINQESFSAYLFLYGKYIDRYFSYPSYELPDTYEEFEENINKYMPQCIQKENIIFFGSLEIWELINKS